MPDSVTTVLRRERDRFVAFAFAAADLLLETDETGHILFAAGASQRLLGCDTDALAGTLFLDLVDAADRSMCRALIEAIRHGGRLLPTAVRLARPESPAAILGGCTLPRSDARCAHLTLSEAVALPTKAQPNGGVLTRDVFLATAGKLMQGGENADFKLSLVSVDGLDDLRQQLPDEVGAGLVSAVERHLQTAGDIEAIGQVADGRYGLVHRDAFDASELQRAVQTLTRAVDPSGVGLTPMTATFDLDHSGLSDSDAARALVYAVQEFASKSDAAFSITSLRGSLDELMRSAADRISVLRSTVDTGAFQLAFQPVVDLNARNVHHVEALARFSDNRSTGGMVAFAEASGLITDFDLAVIQRVGDLVTTGKDTQPPIAVNISGRSLESRIFCAELMQLMESLRAHSRKLLIEITETAAVSEIDEVNRMMQVLRRRGFRVCLDDFGAGASSLHYLRGFEVDFVKIDGKFGRDAIDQPRDRALLRRVIDFSRDIGVEIIVEMIETEEQAAVFRKLGAPFGQGYLFGAADPDLSKFSVAAQPSKSYGGIKRRGYTETWM